MGQNKTVDTEKKRKWFRAIFYLLVIFVFLYFILGEFVLPRENNAYGNNYRELDTDWYMVDENEERTRAEVPGEYHVERGETVVIEAKLPFAIDDKEYLCFRSSQQDMKIFVDGTLREEYSTRNTRLFGKNSPSAYVFVPVSDTDAGKDIRVEITSDSIYSGVLNRVYIGEKMSIWKTHISENGAEFVIAVFLMVLGSIIILFSVLLRIFYDKDIMLEYLGWGVEFVSIWIISESKLRQLFFGNITFISSMAFIMIIIIPIPFAIYMNSVQKERYRKMYGMIVAVSVANLVAALTLQMTSRVDFLDSMIVSHIIIAVAGMAIVGTMIRDLKRGLLGEYRHIMWGFLIFLTAGLIEMIRVYLFPYVMAGIFVGVGMVFLLGMACVKTGEEIINREREKQRMMLSQATQVGFLAHMSHEIRTPLNTIIGMNEMILREDTSDVVHRYAVNLKNAGKTLEAMIGDVLDFAKIQRGGFNIEQSVYYLASLINDSIHLLKASVENKQLEVKYNIDENMPSILKGDEIRIKRILNVLMENAVKHTEEGCITLSIQGDISDSGQFMLLMSVADTGRGIRKEEINTLFDSVELKGKTKNDMAEDSNLRLDIIKRFVNEMGGEIKVSSLYGTGSLFTVKIPQEVINKEPIGDIHKEYRQECAAENMVTERLYAPEAEILAVDDNEMNLEVIKGMLKRSGIQFDFATSGLEAIIRCRKKKYDLILMDHMMPQMDGIEAMHRIKEDEEGLNRETKIIALTANVVTGIRERYLEEGFSEYISKPVDVIKLEKVLYSYLAGKASYLFEEKTDAVVPKPNKKEGIKEAEGAVVEKTKEESPKEIDRQLGLTYCAGDEEMYMEILKAYYERREDYISVLAAAYEKKDWKNYAIKAHALKSISLTLGAKEFSEVAKRHEFAGKEEDETLIQNEYPQFMDYYAKVLEEVKEICGITEEKESFAESANNKTVEAEAATETTAIETPITEARIKEAETQEEISREAYEESMKELLSHIQAYEMNEGLELIKVLLQKVIAGEGDDTAAERKDILCRTSEALEEFDYEKAEEMISAWLKG